jgi:4-amino-4-deoxy-L-arabinose transferase-like glycosyltransferase
MIKKHPTILFYLLCLALLLIISSNVLFTNTMFVDGLIYSTISHNLSLGIGSIWDLHFTKTMYNDFHEHPPLAMYIQSWFYPIFGESRLVDKIHSLTMIILHAFLIIQLWKTISKSKEISWVPVLLWVVTPVVFWSSSNNMLENTLSLFTTLSVLFMFKSQQKQWFLYVLLSGLFISLGFLTKGFVAFFPLILPFFIWLFLRNMSFSKLFFTSLLLVLFAVLPIFILFLISPAAQQAIFAYIEIQVVKSVSSIVTVDSRFFIVKRLFSELLVSLSICLIVYFSVKKRAANFQTKHANTPTIFVFLALGLSAVLPIMISMKQSGFYILPSYPFFMIACTLLFEKEFLYLTRYLTTAGKIINRFTFTVFSLLAVGIILSTYFGFGYGKDKSKVHDMEKIIQVVPEKTMVTICPNLVEDWSLFAYYKRYKLIDFDPNHFRKYLLTNKNSCTDFKIPQDYAKVPLKTIEYELYIKN